MDTPGAIHLTSGITAEEAMTPEERMDAIAEILAQGALRLIAKNQEQGLGPHNNENLILEDGEAA